MKKVGEARLFYFQYVYHFFEGLLYLIRNQKILPGRSFRVIDWTFYIGSIFHDVHVLKNRIKKVDDKPKKFTDKIDNDKTDGIPS